MKTLYAILMASVLAGCGPTKLNFDERGVAHGTGVREYKYESGKVMLQDHYEDGQLERSIWYRTDGTTIREEDWQAGAGTGLYLRQDGSIKVAMPYVNGIAHGMAVYYNQDGTISNVVEFVRGTKQP